MQDATESADETIAADRGEMMNGRSSRKSSMVVHVDVAAEERGIGHHNPAADAAVMCNVSTGHEITMAADGRQTFFFFSPPIDGYSFAKHIVVTDLDAGVAPLVAQVLGGGSNYHAGKKLIVFSYGNSPSECDVVH